MSDNLSHESSGKKYEFSPSEGEILREALLVRRAVLLDAAAQSYIWAEKSRRLKAAHDICNALLESLEGERAKFIISLDPNEARELQQALSSLQVDLERQLSWKQESTRLERAIRAIAALQKQFSA